MICFECGNQIAKTVEYKTDHDRSAHYIAMGAPIPPIERTYYHVQCYPFDRELYKTIRSFGKDRQLIRDSVDSCERSGRTWRETLEFLVTWTMLAVDTKYDFEKIRSERIRLRTALKNLVEACKIPCSHDDYEAFKVRLDEAREVLGEVSK